jgi:His-Xaa-Ser system radical SAM maturase HxsC
MLLIVLIVPIILIILIIHHIKMKQLLGKSYNIKDEIIGRITFGKSIFSRSNDILVSSNIKKSPLGYVATITSNQTIVDNGKPYCVVDNIENFQEGDVVIINNQGEIIFIYEILSNHNAILATERCNHRCIMCPQPPVAQEKDKTPFNLKLISLFSKETKEIGITGGEPTLIGDNLFVLIKKIQKELPKTAISILSNGVKFADKEYAMKLAKCCHHDLQIDIPIFSDVADEHNRIVGAKTFYKTIQGLYNLALFHQRIGLRIVVHRQTYKRLPQLADFIYHNLPFVCQVAFIQMETTGYASDNIDDLWIDPHDYNEQLREAVMLLDNRGMRPLIYNAQLCVLPEDIRRFAMNSISDWKDMYLPICEECKLKEKCGGLFASNQIMHSQYIVPFKDL